MYLLPNQLIGDFIINYILSFIHLSPRSYYTLSYLNKSWYCFIFQNYKLNYSLIQEVFVMETLIGKYVITIYNNVIHSSIINIQKYEKDYQLIHKIPLTTKTFIYKIYIPINLKLTNKRIIKYVYIMPFEKVYEYLNKKILKKLEELKNYSNNKNKDTF